MGFCSGLATHPKTRWHQPPLACELHSQEHAPLHTPTPLYTKRKLTASSHENDILTEYSDQATHSHGQQNAEWLLSSNTGMHDGICWMPPCLPGSHSSEAGIQHLSEGPSQASIVKSRARTQSNCTSGTISSSIPSLPREETWQLNKAAFILHFYLN